MSEHDDWALRVSDSDRDRATKVLREHMADGRLSMEEFAARLDEVLAARTAGEVRHALRDLPAPPGSDAEASPPDRRRRVQHALWRFGTVNGVCLGIWAATGAGEFWPAFVLIPTSAITLRRVFGPERTQPLRRTGSASHHRQHHVDVRFRADVTSGEPRRVVATVLYVDIVDSTHRASAVGDAAWRQLAERYERRAAGAVDADRGELLFFKGDEIVAVFESPAAAVRCAARIRDIAHDEGLVVRAGVHAGEVDRIGARAEGIAMHIGRRVCEVATGDQILVSSTVRDLLAGSDLTFDEVGEHVLKGLTGGWRLYELRARRVQ